MSASQGYLYAMICPAMPGLIKIGCTIYDPLLRTKQLSASTSSPIPFILAYHRYVANPFGAETLIHQQLAEYRINDSREFFAIPLSEAIQVIDQFDKMPESASDSYPFAELFNSFDLNDGEPRALTENERIQCRNLEHSLRLKESRVCGAA